MRQPAGSDEHLLTLRPVVPYATDAYKGYIVASLGLAILLGFALGVHVSVSRLTGGGNPERALDLTQAHGQVQLLGFAGLYVMGMSFRLAPRFAGGRVYFASLIPLILWTTVVSLVLRAVAMPLLDGNWHDIVLLSTSFGLLVASMAFLLITFSTAMIDASRFEAPSLAFVLGAGLLFAAQAIATWAAIDAAAEGSRFLPYLASNAVLQLELTGFLLSFILGVSTRALPAMVGLSREETAAKGTAAALAVAVGLLAACLLYLEYGSYSETIARLAGLAFASLGLVMLQMVWLAGILRPAANRIRPASRPHLWLLRSAFGWLAFAGAVSIYVGLHAAIEGRLPLQLEFDAVRHAITVGLLTQLLAGMSLMILPQFAGERQGSNQQRYLAIALALLFNVATLLRVAPSIAGTAWSSDTRSLLMAVAGSCAEVGMIVFAVALFRLMLAGRRG